MTPAGRHSLNKCPHCGGSPRYGLDRHIMWCPKRPAASDATVAAAMKAGGTDRLWKVIEPASNGDSLAFNVVGVSCPKCGKTLKKRGAHFHIRACKGGDG